jgi:hypothetical protein
MATPGRLRRQIVRGLLAATVGIGVLIAMLWAFQRQLIYHPDTTTVPSAADISADARDVTLQTRDGLDLDAWFFPAPAGAESGNEMQCSSRRATAATGWAARTSRCDSGGGDSPCC